MAYTIKLNHSAPFEADAVLEKLRTAIEADGRFIATLKLGTYMFPKRQGVAKQEGWTIIVKPVRLKERKPYCGQHPGECFAGGPKKKATYLEWDDWVSFHTLINEQLDIVWPDADVWSTPMECKGKMWIRLGMRKRTRWDWTEVSRGMGQPLRIWNNGTDDQFEPPPRPVQLTCGGGF